MSRIAKIGLWGGVGGDRDIQLSPKPNRLVDVHLYTNGNVINALKFNYVDDIGVKHTEGPWGNTTGQHANVVEVADADHIQEISGTYGSYSNMNVLKSLKFVTNSGREYQYGEATGEAFKIPVLQEGKIVAFFARSGDLLDAIGLYILPWGRTAKIGSWGGVSGQPRDIQRSPSRLVRVLVYSTDGQRVIKALKFSYVDDNGVEYEEGPWGGDTSNDDPGVVQLGTGRHVTEISGTYGPYGGVERCITSLRFVTNNGMQYKHGTESGERFRVPVLQGGQIVGFFGRAGDLLHAIGVYILP